MLQEAAKLEKTIQQLVSEDIYVGVGVVDNRYMYLSNNKTRGTSYIFIETNGYQRSNL